MSDGRAPAIGNRGAAAALAILDVIIPALDEEGNIAQVIADLRESGVALRHIVVVDNGSRDRTAQVAREAGAVVVAEPQRGYGAACLRGLAHLAKQTPPPDAVVFIDGDRADDGRRLPDLLQPLRAGADLVVGSRVRGALEPGALQPTQRLGNALAVTLLRALYGQRLSDLGPFRVIRYPALCALALRDRDYGWIIEMQVKAARVGLNVQEVPVPYRRRFSGRSKVSSTLRGTVGAGAKILYTLLRHATVR